MKFEKKSWRAFDDPSTIYIQIWVNAYGLSSRCQKMKMTTVYLSFFVNNFVLSMVETKGRHVSSLVETHWTIYLVIKKSWF